MAHVAMAVVFAPLWRRSGVLTDAAFTELRYGGATAAWLRGIKAFLFALPINCIGIGYAFLAMAKVSEALGLAPTPQAWLTLLAIVGLLVLIYTAAGGLWAVVVTDMLQLVMALAGAVAVAVFAVQAAGGMHAMLASVRELNRPELLSLVPRELQGGQLRWLDGAGIRWPPSAPTSPCSGGASAAATAAVSSSSGCWPPVTSARHASPAGCSWA